MQLRNLFSEALKQLNHPEKHCQKGIPVWSSPFLQKARLLHSQTFYFVKRFIKLADDFVDLPLNSLLTYQQLLCEWADVAFWN